MSQMSQKGKDFVLLASQEVTDGATVTANLDTKGADYAVIRLNLGAEETTDATTTSISLLSSDDTVVTNFATITADQTPGLENAHELRYEVDLKGHKRYLRLSFTAGTGTGSNALVGATGTLYRQSETNATAVADLNDSTNDTVVVV